MPGTTPKLGLRYPLATEAPDGPGAVLQLATDVDNALIQTDLGSQATITTGYAFDTGPGYCDVIKFGQLRIVHFSIFNSTAQPGTATFMRMNAGNRPSGWIYAGGIGYGSGISFPITVGVEPGGSVQWMAAPAGTSTINALRGTLTYWAGS